MKASILGLLAIVPAWAQDYDAWDRVVRNHVTTGEREGISTHLVNYSAVATDPDFATFLDSLAKADTTSLTKNETYALFMNAYNALAIRTVLRAPCFRTVLRYAVPNSSEN